MQPQDPQRHSGPYDQLYGDLYDQFPQERRTVGTAGLVMIKARQSSHMTSDPAIGDVVLRLVTKALTASEVNCGDGRQTLSGQVGSLYVAPDEAVADWTADGEHEIMLLALPRPYLAKTLEIFGQTDPLAPLYGTDLHEPAAAALMTRLWTLGRETEPATALMADGLVTALIGSLADLGERGVPEPEDPPLDPVRLARVREAVEAKLDEALSVDALAAIACLSPAHFSRRFHAATGMTPHAYVLARRLETARHLLAETDDSLADIAIACGFSGQSHFTAKFRAANGLPPGRWRRHILAQKQ